MKALIIGGVAAGMSAASKLRRLRKDAQITVYERGSFLSYGACGIPYYVGGFNDDPDLLIARSREDFEKQGIRTFLRHEAVGLDPQHRRVQVVDLDSGHAFEDSYDVLMLAVGCDVAVPPIPGADAPGVFYVKSMEDALLLERILTVPGVSDVVVIGGGYIGVEMAEALLNLGKSVTLLEGAQRLLTPFEPLYSQMALEELENKGVTVRLEEKVASIASQDSQRRVVTSKGEYQADLVLMCTGVVPATGFLKDSGLNMARNGALLVDRHMRTNLAGVYAAGDCAVVYNRTTGEDFFLPLGTVANKCGRIAGANMAGEQEAFVGALGTAAIKVCDLEMVRTGMSEQDAKRSGTPYDITQVRAYNHPAYYPGRQELTLQLITEKGSRRLLGANVAGPYGSGAVLRGNMLAIAIHAGLSAPEMGMVDLAYAPPFSSVWDAVHIAANAVK